MAEESDWSPVSREKTVQLRKRWSRAHSEQEKGQLNKRWPNNRAGLQFLGKRRPSYTKDGQRIRLGFSFLCKAGPDAERMDEGPIRTKEGLVTQEMDNKSSWAPVSAWEISRAGPSLSGNFPVNRPSVQTRAPVCGRLCQSAKTRVSFCRHNSLIFGDFRPTIDK